MLKGNGGTFCTGLILNQPLIIQFQIIIFDSIPALAEGEFKLS
jgi:hypothetical protein